MAPVVLGKARRGPRRFAIVSRWPENAALFTGQWLFQPYGEERKPALFDRKADPLAKKNLYSKNKAVARELHQTMIRFYKEHGAKREILSVVESARV